MKLQPCGCLPFKIYPKEGDKLVLCPSYIFPIEVFERGILTRLRYLYQTVLVNAYDGRSELIEFKSIEPDITFDIASFPAERLEIKISKYIASENARFDAVPKKSKGWRSVILNRNVAVCEESAKLVWRVYIARGTEIIDTFTGESINSAGLLGMLFS